MPLTPNNREEHWLQGMVDGETTLTPNKRREYWYKEIVDAIGSGGGGGTGGGVLVVNVDENDTMDKTWQEIYDAPLAVMNAAMPTGVVKCPITVVASAGDEYAIQVVSITKDNVGEADISIDTYIASSADDYPVFTE